MTPENAPLWMLKLAIRIREKMDAEKKAANDSKAAEVRLPIKAI